MADYSSDDVTPADSATITSSPSSSVIRPFRSRQPFSNLRRALLFDDIDSELSPDSDDEGVEELNPESDFDAGSADELMNLLHGSDPVKVELNRLENEVRDKDRELSEALAEIKALRLSERLREKVVEEKELLKSELGRVCEE